MRVNDTITIPPGVDTSIPERQERYFAKLPQPWIYMERIGLPRLDKLGRWPKRPWGKR